MIQYRITWRDRFPVPDRPHTELPSCLLVLAWATVREATVSDVDRVYLTKFKELFQSAVLWKLLPRSESRKLLSNCFWCENSNEAKPPLVVQSLLRPWKPDLQQKYLGSAWRLLLLWTRQTFFSASCFTIISSDISNRTQLWPQLKCHFLLRVHSYKQVSNSKSWNEAHF